MANVTLMSAQRIGPKVVHPDPLSQWEATFDPASPADTARASLAAAKFAAMPLT
jgi:hypothetical protein